MKFPNFDEIKNRARDRNWHEGAWSKYVEYLLSLKSKSALNKALRLVFSDSERRLIVKKVVTIKRLEEGAQYREIQNELGVSPQTISEISKSLESGKYKSYTRGASKKRINIFDKQRRLDRRASKPVSGRTKRTKYGRIKY